MKLPTRVVLAAVLVAVFGISGLHGQNVISAKPGLVHHIQGDVLLDGKPVSLSGTRFPSMEAGSVLVTQNGRAEILLNPGAFLRVSEEGEVRMVQNNLLDTRVELVKGMALLECVELAKGTSLSLVHGGATVFVLRPGLYRVGGDPAQVRIYDGKARVTLAGGSVEMKSGRFLMLDGTSLKAQKFNKKKELADSFYRWSAYRAQYITNANMASARQMWQDGVSWRVGSWFWNPFFGCFTYLPGRGYLYSPFGFTYWSPGGYYDYFYRPRPIYADSGGGHPGYIGTPATSSGTSGTVAVTGAPTAAPAAGASPAPIDRSSSQGSGRGR